MLPPELTALEEMRMQQEKDPRNDPKYPNDPKNPQPKPADTERERLEREQREREQREREQRNPKR